MTASRRGRPAQPAPETVIPLRRNAEWYRENKATAWALGLRTAEQIPAIPQG